MTPAAPMRRPLLRMLLAGLALVALAGAALWLWPSLPALQSDLTRLHGLLEHGQGWRARNPELAALAFLGAFTLLGALPVPVVVVLTLAGGAIFGFWLGVALSVAGTVGAALLTFLAARHLLSGPVRRVMGQRAGQLDRHVARDGALALLSLRLTPAVPFFVLNLISGVSRLSAQVFTLVTAVGVLPNKVILTAAGTQLAEIDQIADLFGPRVIAVIAALAIFPWVARWLTRRLRNN